MPTSVIKTKTKRKASSDVNAPASTNDSNVVKYSAKYPMPSMDDVLKRFTSVTAIRPECDLVPQISPQDFDNVVDAVAKDKQQEAILVNEGRELIDGRARLAACYVLGVEPVIEQTDVTPMARVLANLARRHLTTGQKALIALKIAEFEAKAAAVRRAASLKRGTKSPVSQNFDEREKVKGRATEIAGKQLGVSRTSIETVKKLSPEAKEDVRLGKKSIHAAKRADQEAQAAIAKAETASSQEEQCSPVDDPGRFILQFESDTVLVFAWPGQSVQAIVHGPVREKWNVKLSNRSKSYTAETRDDAIKMAKVKLVGYVADVFRGKRPHRNSLLDDLIS